MIAVEQNQENTDGGREQEQPIFREHIRVQQTPTVAHADFVLLFLVDAIEWGKVEVGGRLVNVDIIVGCAEDAENERVGKDDLGPITRGGYEMKKRS